MMIPRTVWFALLALGAAITVAVAPACAQSTLNGQVLGAGAPIANSTVTLFVASAGAPKQLAQARTGADGRFVLNAPGAPGRDAVLYLVARGGQPAAIKGGGDNPAIALMTVVGSKPPAKVTINEMTTVASVWTHAQFLDGPAIRGHALGLRIAAGNVPNFVDLTTGGWGDAIQGPLNSSQTPTMANFATLADVLAGCVIRVTADACSKLFAAATPTGSAPTDTLAAAQSIARYPWYQPEKLFALLDEFYPFKQGKNLRATPFVPYLAFAPSAWVLPLKFDGGGYRAGGKIMFDSEGNAWIGDNFTIGWQGQDNLWQGHLTKFAPNGRPLSPNTTGFTGGGIEGPGFGTAIDAKGNVWVTNYGSKSISLFDKNGKPLSPADGYTFDGQLDLMQGVIVTPSGDVWALGITKNQLVYFPKGDPSKGRLICQGSSDDPCRALAAPFFLAIDQQDRIWVTNKAGDFVTRFAAADPSKVETFKAGYQGTGVAIDSRGNVWIANSFGSSERGKAAMEEFVKILKTGGNMDEYLTRTTGKQRGGPDGGSITLLRPDGSGIPGSPFTGGSLPAPWGVVVDGNDNVWISNFTNPSGPLAHLCGVRTETCPPGMKTGDQISPPGGYVGGGLQMQTDLGLDPAGNIWLNNNWQNIDSCFDTPPEAVSTLCGGQGVTVFYGMAKPVRTPLIGPARQPL